MVSIKIMTKTVEITHKDSSRILIIKSIKLFKEIMKWKVTEHRIITNTTMMRMTMMIVLSFLM